MTYVIVKADKNGVRSTGGKGRVFVKRRMATAAERAVLEKIGIAAGEAETVYHLRFEKGEMLYREGLPAAYLMVLLTGRAKVSISVPSGRKLLLFFYAPGGVLGTVELPLGVPASTDVEALEVTECVALPLEEAGRIFAESRPFAAHLSRLLAEIVVRSGQNAAINTLSSLRERLCAYIASTRDEAGLFSANYSHLAEVLGVSSRHLFREMHRLCADGVLAKEGTAYRVADGRALESLACDCYTMGWQDTESPDR